MSSRLRVIISAVVAVATVGVAVGCGTDATEPSGEGATGETRTGSLEVSAAFVGTHGTSSAAAYLEIRNRGADDALVSVSSPVAAAVTPMGSMTAPGSVNGSPGGGFPLPIERDDPIVFRPGGAHLMLEGLGSPLSSGDTVELQLGFEHAPPVSIRAEVVNVARIPDLMRR